MQDDKQPEKVDAWLQLPWTEQIFKARDAVSYRNVSGIPFHCPATGEEDDPRLLTISGGWDHEHCDICAKTISEEPETENIAFTNGEEWLCRVCHDEHVLGSRIAASD